MYFWGLYQGGISNLNAMEEEANYEGCDESRPVKTRIKEIFDRR
jgi:hypothetical protein